MMHSLCGNVDRERVLCWERRVIIYEARGFIKTLIITMHACACSKQEGIKYNKRKWEQPFQAPGTFQHYALYGEQREAA